MNTREKGYLGEEMAANYLKSAGYKVISRNYYIRGGEIDLIALKNKMLIFVEVKLRFNNHWKISYLKKRRLLRAARRFMYEKRFFNSNWRFDFIVLQLDKSGVLKKLTHIENF